mmetsp:Transcript_1778/g.3589  ORF Transcript_1778/g.3589 Transcript_1778/m.3589 type:complete len:217 (+) Transcript_1778:437-1087(+)
MLVFEAPWDRQRVSVAIELPEEAGERRQRVLGSPAQADRVRKALRPSDGLAGICRLQELPTLRVRVPEPPSTRRVLGVVGVLEDVLGILREVDDQRLGGPEKPVAPGDVQAARREELAEPLLRPRAGALVTHEIAAAQGSEDLVMVRVVLQVIVILHRVRGHEEGLGLEEGLPLCSLLRFCLVLALQGLLLPFAMHLLSLKLRMRCLNLLRRRLCE